MVKQGAAWSFDYADALPIKPNIFLSPAGA